LPVIWLRGHVVTRRALLVNPAEAAVLISLLVVSMATSVAISPHRPKPFSGRSTAGADDALCIRAGPQFSITW
jgi:hypothetical protein